MQRLHPMSAAVAVPHLVSMCRYEGEFHTGFAHGLGVYTASNGQTYRGEWMYGRKHG